MSPQDSLTQMVIGSAIEVHRELGPGLLESVYQKCLNHELRSRGLEFTPQFRLPVTYKGLVLDEEAYRIDFYFPRALVLEIKAVDSLIPVHEAQLLTYLKLSRTHIGLLINFNVRLLKEGIKRMVL